MNIEEFYKCLSQTEKNELKRLVNEEARNKEPNLVENWLHGTYLYPSVAKRLLKNFSGRNVNDITEEEFKNTNGLGHRAWDDFEHSRGN